MLNCIGKQQVVHLLVKAACVVRFVFREARNRAGFSLSVIPKWLRCEIWSYDQIDYLQGDFRCLDQSATGTSLGSAFS